MTADIEVEVVVIVTATLLVVVESGLPAATVEDSPAITIGQECITPDTLTLPLTCIHQEQVVVTLMTITEDLHLIDLAILLVS